jgi:hypothetical protein
MNAGLDFYVCYIVPDLTPMFDRQEAHLRKRASYRGGRKARSAQRRLDRMMRIRSRIHKLYDWILKDDRFIMETTP